MTIIYQHDLYNCTDVEVSLKQYTSDAIRAVKRVGVGKGGCRFLTVLYNKKSYIKIGRLAYKILDLQVMLKGISNLSFNLFYMPT